MKKTIFVKNHKSAKEKVDLYKKEHYKVIPSEQTCDCEKFAMGYNVFDDDEQTHCIIICSTCQERSVRNG